MQCRATLSLPCSGHIHHQKRDSDKICFMVQCDWATLSGILHQRLLQTFFLRVNTAVLHFVSKSVTYISINRCPSRQNPNPDVVRPVWEKHIKDKLSGSSASKKIVVSSTSNTTNNATTAAAAAANNGIRKKKPLTKTVIIKTPSTVMKGRSSSLLREALLLPQRPLPRAYVLQSSSHHNATENRNQIENQSSSENHDRGVIEIAIIKSSPRVFFSQLSFAGPYVVKSVKHSLTFQRNFASDSSSLE